MMHPKSPKWLDDVATRCRLILEFTEGRTPADYEDDALLRSAVERNFEVIGEALRCIEQTDPDTANRISDYRKIIGFRNRLIHGYDTIENEQVWEIIERLLPLLKPTTHSHPAATRRPLASDQQDAVTLLVIEQAEVFANEETTVTPL